MEKFIVKSKMIFLNENQMNVILFPENPHLFDKIEVSEVLNLELDIETQINDLIVLHTPLMFARLQQMENISQNLKDNIEI
jgi:hypothetical protein